MAHRDRDRIRGIGLRGNLEEPVDAHERLTVPTRLLVGTEDVAVKGSSLAGANADDLEVHWIPGVGHFLPDEEPEHVVQHARELL